jgi:hypothetical protein
VPDEQGPTHRYLGASPGCWRLYGEVLAREYSDLAFAVVHRLTVDAYAVQHPGRPSPQTIQSVHVHLIGLCLVLERQADPSWATRVIGEATRAKGRFTWLEPPASMGAVSVADVVAATTPEAHLEAVRVWARSAWSAWAVHHETVRRNLALTSAG